MQNKKVAMKKKWKANIEKLLWVENQGNVFNIQEAKERIFHLERSHPRFQNTWILIP